MNVINTCNVPSAVILRSYINPRSYMFIEISGSNIPFRASITDERTSSRSTGSSCTLSKVFSKAFDSTCISPLFSK